MNQSEEINNESKNWALLAHLSSFAGYIIPFGNIIGPLIIWITKKDTSPFIEEHGRTALNFQISLLIWVTISGLLCLVFIGFFFLFGLMILDLIYTILNAIKASNGQSAKYPLTIKFIS